MEELFSQHATVFLTPSPSKKQKKKNAEWAGRPSLYIREKDVGGSI